MTQYCPLCLRLQSWTGVYQPVPTKDWCQCGGVSALRARMEKAEQQSRDIIADCWSQFSLTVTVDGEEWDSDGCLSTCERIADYLVERGVLVKHPTRRLYRWRDDSRQGSEE